MSFRSRVNPGRGTSAAMVITAERPPRFPPVPSKPIRLHRCQSIQSRWPRYPQFDEAKRRGEAGVEEPLGERID